jgi:hypothetical protein
MDISGGHGFGDWWEKYGAEHPDYFAAAPDGTRKAVKPSVSNTKLCASNPKVWQQWIKDTAALVQADPLLRIINVSPNDGYTSGHCTCANCRAWDHPDGEKVEWTFGGGVKIQGVSQTDRDVRFANTLARLLKQRFPDRELFVQLNAYGLARNPPLGVVPDDNVVISSVANFHLRSPAERKLPMQQHADWAKVTKHLMWRPNLGSPAGLSWGMPDVAMTQAGEDFRFAAETHCLGLYFDLIWQHWANQGPHYYALAHLAWNPQADVAAVMDDYYQRGFGPAAAEVKAYWQLLERTRMEFVAEEPSRHRAFDLPKKYTPELFAQAQAHLDAAAKKLTTADEKYRRRLHFIQYGLDFAAPAGSQTSITPAGLAALQKLPLTVLGLESVQSFTTAHFQAIAGIKSLKTLTVDARKQPANEDAIAAFKTARPDVEVAVSQPGDKGPPQVKKK